MAEAGVLAKDAIEVAIGAETVAHRKRSAVEQENALGAWAERDILGTQMGPNKFGKKW